MTHKIVCTKCGKDEHSDYANFCGLCGTKLEKEATAATVTITENRNRDASKLKETIQMDVYFSSKTFAGEVPLNIENIVKSTFSFYQVELEPNGNVVVKVPKREREIENEFKKNVRSLLKDINAENSVLAKKLSIRYGF